MQIAEIPTTKYIRMTHSLVTSDVEPDWNEWYNSNHVPDLVGVPGYESCIRYKRLDEERKYVGIFNLSDPDCIGSSEFKKVAGNGIYAKNVSSWGPIKGGMSFEEIFRRRASDTTGVENSGGQPWIETPYIRITYSLVSPEVEDDWNEWYNSVHVSDLLTVPGYEGARRFKFIDEPHKYIGIWYLSDPDAINTSQFSKVKGNGPYADKVQSWGPSNGGISYSHFFEFTKSDLKT